MLGRKLGIEIGEERETKLYGNEEREVKNEGARNGQMWKR